MNPRIFQIVGYKNSGKTTLVCKLVDYFKGKGLCVGTIKHDGHDFEIDREGTDTWKHRQAGADGVAIASANRTAWIEEKGASLDELLKLFDERYDLILVEGFKHAGYPKLVVIRDSTDLLLARQLTNVVGVVGHLKEGDRENLHSLPCAAQDDLETIIGWIKGNNIGSC